MPEKLFPERQRCKKCSKKLSTSVLDGLYCSYSCAGVPKPAATPAAAPRGCRLERSGVWSWKQRYRYEGEVPLKLRNDPATNVYRCEHCRFLHVGHDRALGTETARVIRDAATLGSVLLRIRESRKQTRAQVAEAIKTRPIRLKELEEGSKTVELPVLFALISYYRIKLNILL